MTRADRVLSTPPTNTSAYNASRRGFLTQAAAAAAGGAVLGATLPLPESAGASERVPDLIYSVIEHHRTAHTDWVAAVGIECALEEELPRDLTRSCITVWDEIIVDTDDPRWIESERRVDRTSHQWRQAGWELAKVQATTMAGLAALLAYVIEYEDLDDNDAWPQLPPDGEDAAETWSCVFHRNPAKAIEAMVDGLQA